MLLLFNTKCANLVKLFMYSMNCYYLQCMNRLYLYDTFMCNFDKENHNEKKNHMSLYTL